MKKALSLLLSIVMLFSITAGFDFSAYATSKTQNDALSWARSQKGKALDYDGYYGAQCVDLIYYYYNYLGVAVQGGDASAYISNSLPSGWKRVYSGFQAGDIAVWKVNHSCGTCYTDSYGHVGIITSADSSGFNAINQNYCGNMYCTENWFNISALACAIRPNWNTTSSNPNISFSEQSSNSVTNNSAGIHFVTNNPNGATITKFGIRIRKSGTSSWTELIENQTFSMTYTKPYSNYVVGSGKELNYALTAGTTYEWQPLVVVNGKKIYDSKISSFKTTGTAPAAKPDKVSLNSLDTTAYGFIIEWNKVSTATGYQIEYSTNSDFSGAASLQVGNGVTKVKITGRACGKKYYVRVRAYKITNSVVVYGDWSNSQTITTVAKPKNTTLNSVTSTVNGFKVNWSKVSDTTGYQIQYATKSDFSGAATVYGGATNTTSKTITGRAAGTKYYVRVRTYKTLADGSRVWGNWTSAKTVTTKVATANAKSVTGVSNGFKVTWDKIGGITGYQVQYSTRSDFKNAATVYAGNSSATSKTITGRAKNAKYYVRVRAYKNNGGSYVYGSWSSAKTVKTK